MSLSLTKYDNITLIIIIVPLTIPPLCLLWLVPWDTSTVNLYSFYFCRLIGKLTTFFHLQEFSLCNPTSSTITVARCSPHRSSPKWVTSFPRLQSYVLTRRTYITFYVTRSPFTLSNLSPLHLVSIFMSKPQDQTIYKRNWSKQCHPSNCG
jgi:hypothetical protein